MSSNKLKKNYILKLNTLKKHNKLYFEKNSPKISDADFDKLKNHEGEKIVILGGSDLPNIKRIKFDKLILKQCLLNLKISKIPFRNVGFIKFNLCEKILSKLSHEYSNLLSTECFFCGKG